MMLLMLEADAYDARPPVVPSRGSKTYTAILHALPPAFAYTSVPSSSAPFSLRTAVLPGFTV